MWPHYGRMNDDTYSEHTQAYLCADVRLERVLFVGEGRKLDLREDRRRTEEERVKVVVAHDEGARLIYPFRSFRREV